MIRVLMLALLSSCSALLVPTTPLTQSPPAPALGRRAAGFAVLGAALTPAAAFADSIEEIAARNNAAAAKAAEEKAAQEAKGVEENNSGGLLVGGALLGSIALSFPFYSENVKRLGTKVASGGKDRGYTKSCLLYTSPSPRDS